MNNKIGIAICLAVILALGLMLGFAINENKELELANEDLNLSLESIEPVIKEVEVEKEVIKEVPVEVLKEVQIEVPVDNGNLDIVLEHIYDNEGDVNYLVDDLDDDELDMIVERISFINAAKAMAVSEVKSELFDEIDGESIVLADNSTYEFDDKELEKLDIEDDDEDIVVVDVDFDDSDAEIKIYFDFEDEDDKEFKGFAIVEINDGEVDEIIEFEIEEDI